MGKKILETKIAHIFDSWGVLLNAKEAGKGVVEGIREKAADYFEKDNQEYNQSYVDKVCEDYNAVLNGKLGGSEKKEAIKKALEINDTPSLEDFTDCYYNDSLETIKSLQKENHKVVLYTTDYKPWVKEHMNPAMGNKIDVYEAKKGKTSEDIVSIVSDLESQGYVVVSYTADQTPELEDALKSGKFKGNQLVFVDRNGKVCEKEVTEKGIENYTRNTTKIDYKSMRCE